MVTDKFLYSSLIPQRKWIFYPAKINYHCYRNWNASDSLNRKYCVLWFPFYRLSNHFLQNQFVFYTLSKEIATHYKCLLWKSHGVCVSPSHKNLMNTGDAGLGNKRRHQGIVDHLQPAHKICRVWESETTVQSSQDGKCQGI